MGGRARSRPSLGISCLRGSRNRSCLLRRGGDTLLPGALARPAFALLLDRFPDKDIKEKGETSGGDGDSGDAAGVTGDGSKSGSVIHCARKKAADVPVARDPEFS